MNAITLALDTSTPRGSVALLDGETFLFDEKFTADRSHSSSLFVALEKVRALTERIDLLAVGLGPGSFAGVRIAIAAAIGLRFSFGARLVGLPSVAALETAAPEYVAIGDARREAFYFSRVEQGECVDGPLLATERELAQRLEASAGIPVFATEPVLQFPAAQIALPSAAILARLAAAQRGIVATETLEPIYLREPHITQPKSRPRVSPGG
jgi:tRNA threonylcarbamoyl adenosine modification protein YeaZ